MKRSGKQTVVRLPALVGAERLARVRQGACLRSHARGGFTLVEALIATALLGFSLIVMFGFHSQAVRSNMHARKITDCTYLAQLQMERLISLPWDETSRPTALTDLGADSSSSDSGAPESFASPAASWLSGRRDGEESIPGRVASKSRKQRMSELLCGVFPRPPSI